MTLLELASAPLAGDLRLRLDATRHPRTEELVISLGTWRTRPGEKPQPPDGPCPLDGPSLIAARQLAEQGEMLLAADVSPIPDEDGLAVIGKNGDLVLVSHHDEDGKLILFTLSWIEGGGPDGTAIVPAANLGDLTRVLRRGERAVAALGHQATGSTARN